MERFIEQYPADGGGEQDAESVSPIKLWRSINSLFKMAGLFANADQEALKQAAMAGDSDAVIELIGIDPEEVDHLVAQLGPLRELGRRKLKVELETFEERLPEFLETHPGEHVLIRKKEVAGFFPTFMEGVNAGYQIYGNKPFLVQQIVEEQSVIDMPVVGR